MEEINHLLAKKIQEIPPIEFSYETYYSHRKEQSSSKYNVGLLIPKSKKYIAWFTFLGEKDVCILLELNREKQIVHHKLINVVFDQKKPHLALGTFLYGSIFTPSSPETSTKGCQSYFVVEDIFMYKSVSLRKLCFGHRFAILSHILPEISQSQSQSEYGQRAESLQQLTRQVASLPNEFGCGIRSGAEDIHAYSEGRLCCSAIAWSPEEYEFVLPMMFDLSVYGCGIRGRAEDIHAYSEGQRRSPEAYDQEKNVFPDISNVLTQVCYPIHKIQYRSFTEIIPYMNYDLYLFTSKQPKQEKMDVVSVAERSDDRRSSTTNVSGDKVTLNPLWSEKLRFSSGFPVASPTGDVLRISTHILKDNVGVQRNMVVSEPSCQGAFMPSQMDRRSLGTTFNDQRLRAELNDQRLRADFTNPNTNNSSRRNCDRRSLDKFSGEVDTRRSLFVERIEKERDMFMVSADVQSDIYYLNHVHGKYRPDVAYIPNYKTSVFMNSLFRTIKENTNLDTMEESDDEEEFQDIRMEKYVNLEKCIQMECMYHRKFKRWIPIRLI